MLSGYVIMLLYMFFFALGRVNLRGLGKDRMKSAGALDQVLEWY